MILSARLEFKTRVEVGEKRVAMAEAPSIENERLNCQSEQSEKSGFLPGERQNPRPAQDGNFLNVTAHLPLVCELDHGTKNIFLQVRALLLASSSTPRYAHN
jgi:hypothetical protein